MIERPEVRTSWMHSRLQILSIFSQKKPFIHLALPIKSYIRRNNQNSCTNFLRQFPVEWDEKKHARHQWAAGITNVENIHSSSQDPIFNVQFGISSQQQTADECRLFLHVSALDLPLSRPEIPFTFTFSSSTCCCSSCEREAEVNCYFRALAGGARTGHYSDICTAAAVLTVLLLCVSPRLHKAASGVHAACTHSFFIVWTWHVRSQVWQLAERK